MVEKFSEFIAEAKEDYRMLILINDTPDDPNITGKDLSKRAKKLGLEHYQLELAGGYFTTNDKGNIIAHNYDPEKEKSDEVGFEIDPKNTICFVRGAVNHREIWLDMVTELEDKGVFCINSRHSHRICDDKYLNYLHLKKIGLNQPLTEVVTASPGNVEEKIEHPVKAVGGKYPLILKTVIGTKGVGVMFIESEKSLVTVLQLLYKMDEDIGLLIQEYIPTSFDVRVHVLLGEIVAVIKRPVVKGDFRSNVSQGAMPEKIELTELEKSECIKAAKACEGIWVGVDFIPAKNREKDQPFILEVNGSPGTGHIDELNDIDIIGMVIDKFRNRANWLKPKPFQSVYT